VAKAHLVGFIARHGETAANAEDRFRGWLDIPLNDKGVKQAHQAAEFLKGYPIRNVICSPLLRAFVTADVIAAPRKLQVGQHRGLFPLDVGVFSGLSKPDNQAALRLFVKSPDVVIPGGESLADFEERQFAFWDTALKLARVAGLTLFVAHTSNVIALQNLTEDGEAMEPEDGDTVKPGGIAAIYWDGQKHHVEPVFGQAEAARFGGS
jgi:broad specificity phosphatase PhoE